MLTNGGVTIRFGVGSFARSVWLRYKRTDTKPDCDSAIGQHLLDNDRCALNYDDERFSILAAARSSFHLNLLEATYIKTRRPVLCRQKEFVYTLKLFR